MTNAQDLLMDTLQDLEAVNDEIFQAIKQKTLDSQLPMLVERRESISQKLLDLCENNADQLQDLREEVKLRSQDLLRKDQEMITYIELEMQKAQGRQALSQFSSRNAYNAL